MRKRYINFIRIIGIVISTISIMCFCWVTPVSAETIHLNNGKIINAKTIKYAKDQILVKTDKGNQIYKYYEIQEIRWDDTKFKKIIKRIKKGITRKKEVYKLLGRPERSFNDSLHLKENERVLVYEYKTAEAFGRTSGRNWLIVSIIINDNTQLVNDVILEEGGQGRE